MTRTDLQTLIVDRLLKGHGGRRRDWRTAVGDLRLHDLATHPHCNWSATPSGSTAQVAAIEHLLDDVRLSHPVVDPE